MSRLSPAMVDVLEACGEREYSRILVTELVNRRIRAGQSRSVAHASVSRTLRRMWKRGLVELYGLYRPKGDFTYSTMSQILGYSSRTIRRDLSHTEGPPKWGPIPLTASGKYHRVEGVVLTEAGYEELQRLSAANDAPDMRDPDGETRLSAANEPRGAARLITAENNRNECVRG